MVSKTWPRKTLAGRCPSLMTIVKLPYCSRNTTSRQPTQACIKDSLESRYHVGTREGETVFDSDCQTMGRYVTCIQLHPSLTSAAVLIRLLTENPVPSALLATLVFAQHARPFQPFPMIFPPLLLFSTYLNLQGFKIDSAGTTAAVSGTYLVIASRRRMGFMNKFGARGILRGATMGLCLVNVVGGGMAYAFGSRSKEDDKKL